jgi:trans-AT polyketide synthase, acyltransferase and oxidoreductase domains
VTRPIIFMFSGQGSHYYQMGRDLYDQHDVFRRVMEAGDKVLRSTLQCSVIDEIYKHSISKEFNNLLVSHPALVLVEYAVYQVLVSEGLKPDYVWGSSAGEFAASIAAGVFDFETALLIAAEQAKLTARHCERGGMLAVLADPDLYCRVDLFRDQTTLAGVNFANNFVISANANILDKVIDYLIENNIVFQKLPVDYAFHSAAIDGLRVPFIDLCKASGKFGAPKIPFLSSATAGQLTSIDEEYFWQVARGPIQFYKTFSNFAHKENGIFIDCGPSGTLATFIKYSVSPDSRSTYFPLLTPYKRGQSNLAAIKEHLGVAV